MKTALALFTLLPLASSSIHAAVNPAIIPADARWVIYADLDALRTSTIGKELVGIAEKARIETDLGPVGVKLEKVLATIGTITAYGSNFSPKPEAIDGTLVLQGTPDLHKIAESILLQATLSNPESFAEVTDLPFPAYAMKPHGAKDEEKLEVIVAFPPEAVVLVSKSRAQLLKARETFRGAAPSLAKAADSTLKPLLRGSADAYVFTASVVPANEIAAHGETQTRILQLTHSGAIAIGDRGPNTFAHADLIATSDQSADKLMKILQGMTAMMSLAETSDKQLAEFLNSATVARQANTVTLDLAYSSERLAQMIHTLQQKQRPREEQVAVARAEQLINGKVLAEWTAEPSPNLEPPETPASSDSRTPQSVRQVATRIIDNVDLKNGAILSLGRDMNGGRPVRFERIEITPVGGGSPLVFGTQLMRSSGPRGNISMFQFPGVDGTYTLKVTYTNDPAGKARYAVSVRQPTIPRPNTQP